MGRGNVSTYLFAEIQGAMKREGVEGVNARKNSNEVSEVWVCVRYLEQKASKVKNLHGNRKETLGQCRQRILTYFVRGSILVWLTSCLFGFDCFTCVELETDLLVWSNPNQSNKRSVIQGYFPIRSKYGAGT